MSKINVGIISPELARNNYDNINFINLYCDDATSYEFRDCMRKLFMCEYFVVDHLYFIAGIYAGYCFAHNIPIVTKNGVDVNGSYGNFNDEELREFFESLNTQNSVCVGTKVIK